MTSLTDNKYEYTADNVKTYAPNSGGVYVLSHLKQEQPVVFYVGQADDLEKKLMRHLSPVEPDPCVRTYIENYASFFSFIEIDSPAERVEVEQEQIQRLAPRCND